MADKLSQLITDALTRAATVPAGVPLLASKTDAGLFPNTSTAKPAAKRCLDEGLLRIVGRTTGGKTTNELCAVTEKGLTFLLTQVSPKQVLEDFVRVLEARQSQVAVLVTAAQHAASEIAGLKAAVVAVLPQVMASRLRVECTPDDFHVRGTTAVLAGTDLTTALLTRLETWTATAGAAQDCPLPELFRSLDEAPSIGQFHDALRHLHGVGRVYLHPWTGPLYTLPQPAMALLVGHEVAYYASLRT